MMVRLDRKEYGTLVVDTSSMQYLRADPFSDFHHFVCHVERNGRRIRTIYVSIVVDEHLTPRDRALQESEMFKKGAAEILKESMIKMPTHYGVKKRKTDFGWCRVNWREL
ncbi:MAG: hypothetical protein A4E65_03103 [Syntrophorhabdus sp. PtaU1.Bin153]|nr:MAG: hypothetical protein A4E65_03103 [Syntrophorhabdus sp. PtaU1.Bin153]